MAETKLVAKSFSESLTESLSNIDQALPVGFNITRFVQESVSLLNENKQLADFAKQYGTGQIKLGLIKAATLGLSFINHEAYLIPYGSQLNFSIDYRGAVKLAKTYSTRKIKDIYAKVVKDGDELDIKMDDGKQTITFHPKALNDGEIVGVFAVCEFEDGGILYETMTKNEVEQARKQSKAQNSIPWRNFYGEMAKKVCIHRLAKLISLSFESAYQSVLVAEDTAMDDKNDNEIKDVFEDGDAVVVE